MVVKGLGSYAEGVSSTSPGLPHQRLPWVWRSCLDSTLKELRQRPSQHAATLSGLKRESDLLPGVAACAATPG